MNLLLRTNTSELRRYLEDLGYKGNGNLEAPGFIATAGGELRRYRVISPDQWDNKNPHVTWDCAGRIDCGENIELFKELLYEDSNRKERE